MQNLQPVKKSFGNYVKIGYEFAAHTTIPPKYANLFNKVSVIDDSVLIIDDILDQSSCRNGKSCLYKKSGLESALITAKLQEFKSFNALVALMNVLKTSPSYRLRLEETFNEFLYQVYVGQKIDLELCAIKNYDAKLIPKYFEMIRTFTGGHVKYALRIGQLLANTNPNENVDRMAESLGVIRQICDDFDDYFEKHHEPFGDFQRGCNRLPEILFKKQKGSRRTVLNLISNKEYEKARKIVLNNNTRKILYSYCETENKKIARLLTKVSIQIPEEDFHKMLLK